MATFTRRTVLANPARRRKSTAKRSNPKRRKLSPAQIKAGFGGKRRKAAVKRKPASHRPASKRANPKRRKPATSTRRVTTSPRKTRRARNPARSNPGDIITLALNPAAPRKSKGTKTMARRRKRTTSRRRATAAPRRRRRRTNPVAVAHRRRTRRRRATTAAAPRRRRRRTNPSRRRSSVRRRRNPAVSTGRVGGIITKAAWAIGGAVGSKVLTQMVLGSSNTGWMGYGGNLAAAFALGAGVKMFLKNQPAGDMVILGGVIQTLLRVLIDKTPFGSKVQNLGMGDYMAQNFLVPQRVVDGLNSAQLQPPVMPMMAQAGKGMGVYGGKLY